MECSAKVSSLFLHKVEGVRDDVEVGALWSIRVVASKNSVVVDEASGKFNFKSGVVYLAKVEMTERSVRSRGIC